MLIVLKNNDIDHLLETSCDCFPILPKSTKKGQYTFYKINYCF